MSFLDNLENNLKALESREEKDPAKLTRERAARNAAKELAIATAPYAEALRTGPFATDLLTACRKIGHASRTLVRMTWVESIVRLEAGDRKLELRPAPDGVQAAFFSKGQEQRTELVDLNGNPEELAHRWMEG